MAIWLLLRPFEPAKGNEYVEVMLLQQIPYAWRETRRETTRT